MYKYFPLIPLLLSLSISALAKGKEATEKKDSVKVQKSEETININVNSKKESVTETQAFCGEDAKKKCEKWILDQKATLKDDLRTSSCSDVQDLYGKEDKETGCMSKLVRGKITYRN